MGTAGRTEQKRTEIKPLEEDKEQMLCRKDAQKQNAKGNADEQIKERERAPR